MAVYWTLNPSGDEDRISMAIHRMRKKKSERLRTETEKETLPGFYGIYIRKGEKWHFAGKMSRNIMARSAISEIDWLCKQENTPMKIVINYGAVQN